MESHSPHRLKAGRQSAARRELSRRQAGGLEVVLYWREGGADVTISVRDANSGEQFELAVEPSNALDAFRHPYAYAARRSVPRDQGRAESG